MSVIYMSSQKIDSSIHAERSAELLDSSLKSGGSAFYGSGLFFKFFLWFWLAVVLTGFLVAVYSYFYHFVPENRRMFRMGRELLEENGQMVVEAYESQGVESALSISLPGTFWLFDAQLNNLFVGHQHRFKGKRKSGGSPRDSYQRTFVGREDAIKAVAGRILAGTNADTEEVGGEPLIGCLLTSESQKKYVIINHIPVKMPRHQRFLMDRLVETLSIFLLVTAFFCFALSRYMVKPITELREASSRFANGDLSARASNGAAKRFDEIGDLAVDFNHMADKIANMIRSQRRLFGDISHELRSPLARLQVTVEILQKKVAESDQPMLVRIEKEIARMNSLIEEVLQFSRLESGSYDGEKQIFAVSDILYKICSDADFEGKAKKCSVKLQATSQVRINAVPQLIERAMENVLRNALKYSPENSQVLVSLSENEHNAIVTIADSGPGVAEAEIHKLFSPFYRCQEDRDRNSGGIGLGLAIAHRAIKLHKGEINLKNRTEGGLLAEIVIPLA